MRSLKSRLADFLPATAVMHLKALDHYLYGEAEIRLLKDLVDPHRQAIDAGANIGTYSYFLRKYASKVFAYEPNPDLAAKIRTALPTVQVRQVALSDRSGELNFSVPLDSDGRQCHELGSVAQTFSGQVRKFSVQCITIDSERLDNVGFLKIDVEQHEREVLRGAVQTIDQCRPVILVEVYPLKYAQTLSEEFKFILNKRYCAWFSFDGRWIPLNLMKPKTHADLGNFGNPRKFMGNNLIFFPIEHPRATSPPRERS